MNIEAVNIDALIKRYHKTLWKIKSDKAKQQKESNTGSETDNKARNKKLNE